MNGYTRVFESLHFPSIITQCAAGTINLPVATFRGPAEWYGFPPALIPIWSDGSGPTYIGVWKHWFMDRKPTYVKMYVDSERSTIEIARTAEQLFAFIAMTSIGERDGIERDLLVFAKEVGLQNLEQINSVSLINGDSAHGLVLIDQFKNLSPLESVSKIDLYSGEFPNLNFGNVNSWWESACSFEISREILANWPDSIVKPLWIDSCGVSKVELFNDYLIQGNLKNAWLTLNSNGWKIPDAKKAISSLRSKSKDSQFSLLVDTWLTIAEDSAGGY